MDCASNPALATLTGLAVGVSLFLAAIGLAFLVRHVWVQWGVWRSLGGPF